METEKREKIVDDEHKGEEDDDDDCALPGFRFHPTDEELVGFYLRRKVENRRISIELIKHIDIYKFDPWDLPKGSNVGDKEWYFFCRRGRKYRNSIRPNRVTGSGFWKATGIDRPIYSDGRQCIGLKKSLVYYRGCAGKGTKTDWMMHEFRLPPPDYNHHHKINATTKHLIHLNDPAQQEAEVWTLCRILKRNTLHKKCLPDWREMSSSTKKRNNSVLVDSSSKTCSTESDNMQGYNISFRTTTTTPVTKQISEKKPIIFSNHVGHVSNNPNQFITGSVMSSTYHNQPPSSAMSSYSTFSSPEVTEFVHYGDWDELRSVVEFAGDPFLM